GDRAGAVVAEDDVLRVARIDPEVVMVAVRALADLRERPAAVCRSERARVQRVDDVPVVRIGEDVRVVESALTDIAARVHQLPRRARICGGEEAPVLGLDQRVHTVRVGARDGDADLADHALRQARVARDLAPGVAAVGRLEQAAAGAAARHLILDAIRLPHCREQDVRIPAIDLDVHGARLAVAEQLPLPRLPAVGALVEAALVARRAVASEVGDEDDVGVRRMDANLRDRVGVGEAGMGPRLAGVGRLVDAVARHDVAADARLARADEDDVGLRFRDGDGADRRAPDLAVGDGRPFRAAVDRLPQSAAGRAEVAFSRPPLHAGDGDRPAAAVRADAAPFEGGHDGLIEDVLAGRRLRGETQGDIPSGCQSQRSGEALDISWT